MLGFVGNSRATFQEIINSGIRHNTYSRFSKTLSHFVLGNELLASHLKLLTVPSCSALDVFHLTNSRVTHVIIHGINPR